MRCQDDWLVGHAAPGYADTHGNCSGTSSGQVEGEKEGGAWR